jgi:hypothetical protein
MVQIARVQQEDFEKKQYLESRNVEGCFGRHKAQHTYGLPFLPSVENTVLHREKIRNRFLWATLAKLV